MVNYGKIKSKSGEYTSGRCLRVQYKKVFSPPFYNLIIYLFDYPNDL